MSTDVANPYADEDATFVSVFSATLCRSDYWEDVTAEFLRESDGHARIRGPILMPLSYMADVGAALELRSWQLSGLVPERLQGYPAWNLLFSRALDRASNPDPATDPLLTSLQHDLDRGWYEESVWESHRLLGAPFRAGKPDVDLMIDALARFLWDNRHLAKTEG